MGCAASCEVSESIARCSKEPPTRMSAGPLPHLSKAMTVPSFEITFSIDLWIYLAVKFPMSAGIGPSCRSKLAFKDLITGYYVFLYSSNTTPFSNTFVWFKFKLDLVPMLANNGLPEPRINGFTKSRYSSINPCRERMDTSLLLPKIRKLYSLFRLLTPLTSSFSLDACKMSAFQPNEGLFLDTTTFFRLLIRCMYSGSSSVAVGQYPGSTL